MEDRGGVTLHPADEIPGGLWPGAPFHARHRVLRKAPMRDAWPPHLDGWTGGDPIADYEVNVILPGPLGLGLAGLAARVAGRLQLKWTGSSVEWLRDVLSEQDWAPARWWDDCPDPWEVIPEAASYLALTDRLCAAVGLELQPGEVARWERGEAGAGWWLRAGGENHHFGQVAHWLAGAPMTAHHDTGPAGDDWLGALRACVAATEEEE